jgi:hypothetical protein
MSRIGIAILALVSPIAKIDISLPARWTCPATRAAMKQLALHRYPTYPSAEDRLAE